jgi:hypothetical protein
MLTNHTKSAKSTTNPSQDPRPLTQVSLSPPGRTWCVSTGSWFTQGVPFIDPPVLRGGPGDTGDPAGAGGGPGVDAGELTAGGETGDPLAGEGRELRAALWPREKCGIVPVVGGQGVGMPRDFWDHLDSAQSRSEMCLGEK